jgi:hypothetical protein
MNPSRFLSAATCAITATAVLHTGGAQAFDLEDYHTTMRATRDAWLRAYLSLRSVTPRYLAARHILESWGVDVTPIDKPYGYDLAPEWCESWQGETNGHALNLGLETRDYSGTFDFYGRGHDMHGRGRGLGHHHDSTTVGTESTADAFLDHSALLRWRDRYVPGLSDDIAGLLESAIETYEQTGFPQVSLSRDDNGYSYYSQYSVQEVLCDTCRPCPEAGCADPNSGQQDFYYYYSEQGPYQQCTTDDGAAGYTVLAPCPATPPNGEEPQWKPFPTFEEAVQELLVTYDLRLGDVEPDRCEYYWFWGEGCYHGESTPYCDTDARFVTSAAATLYRAQRDAYLRYSNELMLATPPFRAAVAGFAAAVETYHSNTPCSAFAMPNIPNIPEMPGPATENPQ